MAATPKRRRFVWVAFAVGIAFALILYHLHFPGRINDRTWNQIARGMTEKQVEDILGGPATRVGKSNPWGPDKTWSGNGNEIEVLFDQEGKVRLALFRAYDDSLRAILRRWRRQLGW